MFPPFLARLSLAWSKRLPNPRPGQYVYGASVIRNVKARVVVSGDNPEQLSSPDESNSAGW